MTINKEIHTILHYKDITLIAAALGQFQKIQDDEEVIKRCKRLVDRLGAEMYSHPKFDFTKPDKIKKKHTIAVTLGV